MSSNELSATSNWVSGTIPRSVQGDVIRLFCFPYAGGGASLFRPWVTALAPAIEVCPVQLPGREDRWREAPLTDLSALATALSAALAPLLDAPFAFFGHSMGAFVAFELARQLRRAKRREPSLIVVSGARAPQIPDPDPQAHQLPADQLLLGLQRFDGIPKELLNHPDLVALLLPTLRADLAMCETYMYRDEPPLDCAISVYGGEQDEKIPPGHLPPWQVQTRRGFQLRMFPGNHFFFLKEARTPVLSALREDAAGCLHRLPAASVVAPQARLEQWLAGLWTEVLGVTRVGLDDNFFELGGNSLLMLQAYARLRASTSTTLSVVDLFRYPTIRLLAGAIGSGQTSAAGAFNPLHANRLPKETLS